MHVCVICYNCVGSLYDNNDDDSKRERAFLIYGTFTCLVGQTNQPAIFSPNCRKNKEPSLS